MRSLFIRIGAPGPERTAHKKGSNPSLGGKREFASFFFEGGEGNNKCLRVV